LRDSSIPGGFPCIKPIPLLPEAIPLVPKVIPFEPEVIHLFPELIPLYRRILLFSAAAWIWNIADFHFKGAIRIIDLFHALEHYWDLAKKIFSGDNQTLKKWTKKRRKELDSGKV
jgi:hypothetical protein